jgi:pimeloyl-ACP methyl ester carboxylesterase
VDLQQFFGELAAWAQERDPGAERVAYGAHPEQWAERRGGGTHTAVVIHGGFWRSSFTLANTRALAVDLALRGWTTWNVEYRRLGADGGIPETLEDISAAIALAGPGAVAIGHSAGGHLALWAAGDGAAAAVSLGGVTDLSQAARDGLGDGAATELAGGSPEERPDAYRLADPMLRLPLATPQLLVHGDADDRVPVDYSRRYAAAAGGELLELAGVGHFEPIDPRTDAWAQIAARLDPLVPPPPRLRPSN